MVLGVIAMLSVVVIVAINPAELLKQGRDSVRLSDLALINKALNVYQTDNSTGSLGDSSIIYVSIPDLAATSTLLGNNCSGLGLPTLPSGYTYHCPASSTYRNTNGTGWMPVNFKSISYGSPLEILPVDPINTISSGNYYTYTGTGGSWELDAMLEANKNIFGGSKDKTSTDGGDDPIGYEVGTNLKLAPAIGNIISTNQSVETAAGSPYWAWLGSYTGTVSPSPVVSSVSDSSAPNGNNVAELVQNTATTFCDNISVGYGHLHDGGMVPVAENTVYTFAYYVKTSIDGELFSPYMQSFNGAGVLPYQVGSAYALNVSDGWVAKTFTFTTSATANHIQLLVNGKCYNSTGSRFKTDYWVLKKGNWSAQ